MAPLRRLDLRDTLILHGSFVDPNELEPERAVPIFRAAPAGVDVAVGTERCLLAPVVNEHIGHVVMADHDPRVIYYNEINLALIGASKNRNSYRALRAASSFEAFVGILDALGYTRGPDDLIDLRQRRHYKAYRAAHKRNGFRRCYDVPDGPFAGLSYLHDDAAFARIKSLVDQGRIVTRRYDVADPACIEALERDLDAAGLRIGVMDISNCWWGNYVGLEQSPDRRFVLGPDAFADKGLVLVTDRDYAKPWYYTAFERRQLAELFDSDRGAFRQIFSKHNARDGTLKRILGKACIDRVVDLGRHGPSRGGLG